MNINLTAEQLRRAAQLKEQIETMESELASLLGSTTQHPKRGGRGMSAAGRARIAAAQRARWRKVRADANGASTPRRRRRMSSAARARLAAIARARWRKVKDAGKKAL